MPSKAFRFGSLKTQKTQAALDLLSTLAAIATKPGTIAVMKRKSGGLMSIRRG
jgi:hypothetical protein